MFRDVEDGKASSKEGKQADMTNINGNLTDGLKLQPTEDVRGN